jgi:hypothetical protein
MCYFVCYKVIDFIISVQEPEGGYAKMLIKLLIGGTFIVWIALTIAITLWWRNKFVYIYGGDGAVWKSWYGTLIGAGLVSLIIVSVIAYPLTWMDQNCPYLPDVLAVGGIGYYLVKRKKNPEGDNAKQELQATGDTASKEDNNVNKE